MKDNSRTSWIDAELHEVVAEVHSLGAAIEKHAELIEELFWDGFSPQEIVEAIEVEEAK